MVRKMPAHIVLPNGMWRFVKKGKSKRKSKPKVVKMARKYRRSWRGRVRSYGRRASSAGRGLLGGIAPRFMAGSKLAIAETGVNYAEAFIPGVFTNPAWAGIIGLVVPNIRGVPFGNVLVSRSEQRLVGPMVNQVISGTLGIAGPAMVNAGADPYKY